MLLAVPNVNVSGPVNPARAGDPSKGPETETRVNPAEPVNVRLELRHSEAALGVIVNPLAAGKITLATGPEVPV